MFVIVEDFRPVLPSSAMKNTNLLPDDSAASGNRLMLRFIIPLVRLLATSRQCGGFFSSLYHARLYRLGVNAQLGKNSIEKYRRALLPS
jgi:hypothetical protein